MKSLATMLAMGSMALGLAACESVAPQPRLHRGDWGGDHVALVVEPARVTFLFECAGGSIDGAMALLSDGSFDVNGTFAFAGNAQGIDRTPRAARYIGQVTGRRISFRRVLIDGSAPDASFVAEFGVAPAITDCP